LPPRAICPEDLAVTRWQPLSGQGTLISWTTATSRPPATGDTPQWLAYLALEGADTLFLHHLRASEQVLRHGLPVAIAFAREAVDHPLELCWFEPVDDGTTMVARGDGQEMTAER
jgi:uncharacterized OB-fold protein